MFTDYEQKLHMITYYKQAYVWLLSIRKAYARLLSWRKSYARLRIMSRSYTCLLNISKVYAFSFNMTMVYTYILIDSTSEVYTCVLFDVVSVHVYLCTCILCRPCSNIIRLDVFRVIWFETEVKNV